MSKLNQEELLEELNQMEMEEEGTHKGTLQVSGVNTELMHQLHQKRKQAYQQIREMIEKKLTITTKDIREWADEASDRVNEYKDWGYIEDAMKEMLNELGVEVVKK